MPKRCHILYTPAGATHFLQRLDCPVFRNLKSGFTDAANATIAEITLGDDRPVAESMNLSRAAAKLQILHWRASAREARPDMRANARAHLLFKPGDLEKFASQTRDLHASGELFMDVSAAGNEPDEMQGPYLKRGTRRSSQNLVSPHLLSLHPCRRVTLPRSLWQRLQHLSPNLPKSCIGKGCYSGSGHGGSFMEPSLRRMNTRSFQGNRGNSAAQA